MRLLRFRSGYTLQHGALYLGLALPILPQMLPGVLAATIVLGTGLIWASVVGRRRDDG